MTSDRDCRTLFQENVICLSPRITRWIAMKYLVRQYPIEHLHHNFYMPKQNLRYFSMLVQPYLVQRIKLDVEKVREIQPTID